MRAWPLVRMIERHQQRYGSGPRTLAADNTYGNGELLQWLDDRGITPYIRVKENPLGKSDLYGIDRFTYVAEHNCYLCPAGKQLKYVGINQRNRTHLYHSTAKRCRDCSQKEQCTRGKYRDPYRYTPVKQPASEPMRWQKRRLSPSAQRARRKVEALFAELKNQVGLRRLRLRRMKFVREQFYLAATAQNIKRLVRFLSKTSNPTASATA